MFSCLYFEVQNLNIEVYGFGKIMTDIIKEPFFEGAEKLLEIWFTGQVEVDDPDLRKIPRQKLESLLKLVHCEVISFTSNDNIDAYVLSESSMFVTRRRFILKTCGTTTPLQCIKVLIMLVKLYSGFSEIEKLFYSHKSFKKPELQKDFYRHFGQEVAFLNKCFKSVGRAYSFSGNDEDQWYLYTLYPEIPLSENETFCFPNGQLTTYVEPDQTLEIAMSDLDPKIMSIFNKENCATAKEATAKSGIDKLIPMMNIDDYLFDPCGYSMNGILPNGAYMTIHVTPENDYSYVSFETNVALCSYRELIQRVLETFQPEKFVITTFANKKSPSFRTPKEVKNMGEIDGWCQLTSDICQLSNYDMTVAFYSKFPS